MNAHEDTMRPEYDFDLSKAIRGKCYQHLKEEGTNIVTIQPNVSEGFPDSESVNEALRSLIEKSKRAGGAAKSKRKRRPPAARARAEKR